VAFHLNHEPDIVPIPGESFQVNHSPSFHTDAQIDRDIKESLLRDTFIILNLTQADKKKVIEEDHRRVRERLLQGINHKER
jgi:tubulin polyglutamylase TTLL6/13